MTKIITSPDKFKGIKGNNLFVFLGGPIQGAPNWQSKICDDLSGYENLVITNPRRKSLDKSKFNYNEQVKWESEYLNESDILVFWLPKEEEKIEGRMYGQTTRFEIGEWMAKCSSKIIIGIDEDFPMKRYIKNRLEKDYDIKVLDTYNEVLKSTQRRIDYLSESKTDIFLTSDNHFGSQRALELSKRPFKSLIDMDQEMINLWNSVVKPNDKVYHLGDFGEYSVIDKLNGNIYLILGNYEIDDMNKNYKGDIKSFKKMLINKGFKAVYDNMMLKINDDTEKVLKIDEFDNDEYIFLTHEPLDANRSLFNCFGHIHGRQKVKRYGLDVGVDANHFKPINKKEVLFYKEAIEKYYDDNVFE